MKKINKTLLIFIGVAIAMLFIVQGCGHEDVPTPTPIPTVSPTPSPISHASIVYVFGSPASKMSNDYLKKFELQFPRTLKATVYVVYGNNFGEAATELEVQEWKKKLSSRFEFVNDVDCKEYKKHFLSSTCVVPLTVVQNDDGKNVFIGDKMEEVLKVVQQ